MKHVISVITGSRADFGLLQGVISEIHHSANLEDELIVTGSHLSEKFGSTFEEISNAGFTNLVKLELNLSTYADTNTGFAISEVIRQLTNYYSKNRPSLTLILGDRYEILGAAVACATLGIPIGHIHGGEVTSGSKDDLYRHAITKLSSLHFVANEEFQSRVVNMGEDSCSVFVVGGLGLDAIARINTLDKSQLENQLGVPLESDFALITYHSDTIKPAESLIQLDIILKSLAKFPNMNFIATGANADFRGEEINLRLKNVAAKQKNFFFFESLGQQSYVSLLSKAKFVLGNSSSGLLEAPFFGLPTINIGHRQDGRPRASTVFDVECSEISITRAIKKLLSLQSHAGTQLTQNPYGTPGACKKITEILTSTDFGKLLPKKFIDAK